MHNEIKNKKGEGKMKLRKLLTMVLAGALLIGGVITANAAELDMAWYAEKNPDVVAAVGDSPLALQQHYDTFGRKEGRMANDHDVEAQLRRLFDAEEYAALYPDVKDVFGEDVEAMFQHYISFGLLEARRPSNAVSYEAAAAMKETVEKAMKEAGLDATPGSAQIVAIIEGNVSSVAGDAVVQQAMEQVAAVVESAVTETADKVNAPAPVHSTPATESGNSVG